MADCVVTGEPVVTHRYVQVIPLVEVEEKSPGDLTDVKSGKHYRVPKPDDPRRIEGKRFASLDCDLDEIMQTLDLDPEGLYELRHRPARYVTLVSPSDCQSIDVMTRTVVLKDGAMAQLNGFVGEKLEIDFGVLMKCRCRGDQARDFIGTWKRMLQEA